MVRKLLSHDSSLAVRIVSSTILRCNDYYVKQMNVENVKPVKLLMVSYGSLVILLSLVYQFKSECLMSLEQVSYDKRMIMRWVTKYKYLGTILTDDLSDDSNMLRQRGICYVRCNSLIRNFS